MTLREWRIGSTSDDAANTDDGVRGERRAYRSGPFPRRRGGSLVVPKISDNAAGDAAGFALHGNGWYCDSVVEKALQYGIIKLKDIKYIKP